jgi:hypothetical protein
MLEWSIPEAEDEDWINSCIAVSGTMAFLFSVISSHLCQESHLYLHLFRLYV